MTLSTLMTEAMKIAPFVALVSVRVGVVLSLMPAPFGELAPARIRAALSFVLAYVLAIPTLGNAFSVPLEAPALFISALSEFIIGAVIGLTVRVALAAAESAGTLAGNAMGLGFAGQMDPLLGSEGVPTTMLTSSLAVLIFFVLHGHHVVLQAVSATLTLAPAGQGFPSLRLENLTLLGARMITQGLRIAAPVVATMFLVQVGTALVARAAPRVQIFALSFGVSVSIGALVLVMSAPQLAQGIGVAISNIPSLIADVLPGAR